MTHTLIEFNHDYALKLDKERFEFCNALVEVLRGGESEGVRDTLRRLGATVVTQDNSDIRAEALEEAAQLIEEVAAAWKMKQPKHPVPAHDGEWPKRLARLVRALATQETDDRDVYVNGRRIEGTE